MRVLITGDGGQLARALSLTAPKGTALSCVSRQALDITDTTALHAAVQFIKPDIIFNTAAWTDVDAAEREETAATAVNGIAPGRLAEAAGSAGSHLVHISTDFVFDGSGATPYRPQSSPNPMNAYGRSKHAGERSVGMDALIVRTSWLYSSTGAKSVAVKMLDRLRRQSEVMAVCDEIRAPTLATDLAAAIWQLARDRARGIFHYTDSGSASLYEIALVIEQEARRTGLLQRPVQVVPVSRSAFEGLAPRPCYSVLDCTATTAALGRPAPHWRANFERMLMELA